MVELVTNSCRRLKHSRGCLAACSWNQFGHQFATSSRDKTVKIWSIENEAQIKQILALPPVWEQCHHCGLDWTRPQGEEQVRGSWNGKRTDRAVDIKIIETEECTTATAALALVSAVNRLAWRPNEKSEV